MGESSNDRHFHIRISKELHQDWKEACREQSVNGSALIRKWMQEYVQANKK